MANRKVPPRIQMIDRIDFPEVGHYHLDNGILVYQIAQPDQEVFRLEVVVDAGRPYESAPLVSRITQQMLREGTRHRSGSELAEYLDYYGASLSLPAQMDTANLVVQGLRKHFEAIVTMVAELLRAPSFPEDEWRALRERSKANLRIELEKNEVVAYRQITEYLFGETHPYGYNSHLEAYDQLTVDQLRAHHDQYYRTGQMKLFLAGGLGDREMEALNNCLGQGIPQGKAPEPRLPGAEIRKGHYHIPGSGQLQTAIRVGRPLVDRKHPDYHGLYILNTVLGGYFGSRLMDNIREEKGLTYNIYSSLDTNRHDGCWLIACETSPEHVETCLTEIEQEMRILREELIDQEELEMVRNYLLGTFLSQVDGSLNSMEWLAGLISDGLDPAFFSEAVQGVNEVQPEDIQRLAQSYLEADSWTSLTVGVKS